MLTLSTLAQELFDRGTLRPVLRVDFGAKFGSFAAHDAGWLGTFISQASDSSFYDESNVAGTLPQLLLDLSSLSQTLDIGSGAHSTGAMTAKLDDHPQIRELVSANRLLGKDMIVLVGFDDPDWRYTDWIPVFRGVVTGWDWSDHLEVTASPFDSGHMPTRGPNRRESATLPSSVLAVTPHFTTSTKDQFTSYANPLTLISYLLMIAQVPSRFIDATSIDPTTVANDDLSHLRVSLAATGNSDRRIHDGSSIWDVIQKLAYILRGFVHFTEEGEFTFTRLDLASLSSVATWGDGDLRSDVDIVGVDNDDLIVTAQVKTACLGDNDIPGWMKWAEGGDKYGVILEATTDDAEEWGYQPDDDNNDRQALVADSFFGAMGGNLDAFDASSLPDPFPIYPITAKNGALGTNEDATPANGYGWPGIGTDVAAVSADRPLYLAVVDPVTGAYCVIKATGLTLVNDPADYPVRLEATGTTFVAGDATMATADMIDFATYDVSATWPFIEWMLSIFGDSAARISEVGKPHTYPVQVGDVVRLDTTRYVDFGYDGDPGTADFMVVEKQVNWADLSINWGLVKIADSAPTLVGASTTVQLNPNLPTGNSGWTKPNTVFGLADFGSESGTDALVLSGCIGGVSADLTHTVSVGSYVAGRWEHLSGEFDHTYSDDVDTWVYGNSGTLYLGALALYTFTEVANGAPRPATPSGSTPIMRVRTESGAITEVLDLRNRGIVGTRGITRPEKLTLMASETFGNATISGFDMEVPGGGGLTGVIPPGVVDRGGVRAERLQDENHTFTASKWTYVDVDDDGDLAFVEVAAGVTEPAVADGYTRVLVVVTDGSDITKVGRYPVERRGRSRSIAAEAIGDGFGPNALLDDYDAVAGLPYGWSADEGTDATVTTRTDYVTTGRYCIRADVGAAATATTILGPVFTIYPLELYTLRCAYSTGGYAHAPACSIGLEFFDFQMQSIAVRYSLISGAEPTKVATDQGFELSANLVGAGAGTNQIPATARYARWYIDIGKAAGGASGIHLSAFKIAPAVASGLIVNNSDVYPIGACTNQQVLQLQTLTEEFVGVSSIAGFDSTAIHDDTAGEIHAIASKGTPVDADELVIEDSAASWAKKRITIGSLPGGGGSSLISLLDISAEFAADAVAAGGTQDWNTTNPSPSGWTMTGTWTTLTASAAGVLTFNTSVHGSTLENTYTFQIPLPLVPLFQAWCELQFTASSNTSNYLAFMERDVGVATSYYYRYWRHNNSDGFARNFNGSAGIIKNNKNASMTAAVVKAYWENSPSTFASFSNKSALATLTRDVQFAVNETGWYEDVAQLTITRRFFVGVTSGNIAGVVNSMQLLDYQ